MREEREEVNERKMQRKERAGLREEGKSDEKRRKGRDEGIRRERDDCGSYGKGGKEGG